MDSVIRNWSVFLDWCLAKRAGPALFEAAANQLYAKYPITGRKLAGLLLRPKRAASNSVDPRLIIYLELLLALKKVDASDVLLSAFEYSRDHPPKASDETIPLKQDPSRWQNPLELDEIIFHRLQKAFSSGQRPCSNAEAFGTLAVVSKWMSAMVTSHTNDSMLLQAMAGIQQHPQQQSINVREALGLLVVALIENVKVVQVLNKEPLKELRKTFAQALSTFIGFLSQTSLPIANRLEISQKEHNLHDKSLSDMHGENGQPGPEVAALQLEAVMDLPSVNTRAGLYIFLNSLLVARPLTDDLTIISYLQSRYKIDTQNLSGQNVCVDLITASFDVLSNAMYRNEPPQTMLCLKSFLVNKIPLLLLQLTATIYPLTPEFCITQALSHVDRNAFPNFSQGFDDLLGPTNSLADVRQDFLNSCALHNLLPANHIQNILGETPIHGPPERKYVKNDLLKQCKDNFEKVNALIDELETLNGNGGAIVAALTEFISHLCETQTTMYLKSICNLLFRKPQVFDVMLQFTSPASFLRPLCQFLEEWRYEGDQGEYQPVYDEFGAILILILSFVYRYDLSFHELGLSQDSFVAQLLDHGDVCMAPDELSDEQGRQLGNWLGGLYDRDKEGLSNDVFSSCRPQQFYLIVPTLFSQTVYACSAEVLSLDSVKGGLEYLHETFLLPSLVGGLSWMASHALEQTHQDLEIIMQMFHKLIRSVPTSSDAQAMHSTILSILSGKLEKCFRNLQRRFPNRNDIEPLLNALKSNANHGRSSFATMTELEQWTSTPGNTIRGSIRNTIRELCIWCSGGSLQMAPPAYSHRLILSATQVIGAYKTLRAIIEEVKAQSEAGNGPIALDIAVSLISAPSNANSPLQVEWMTSPIPAPPPPRTAMNLREMLKAEFDNAASLISTDPLGAETIVRLHRRVEAQLAIDIAAASLAAPQIDLPGVDMVGVESQHISQMDMDAVNNAAAASIAAAGAEMGQQALQREFDQHLELTASGGGLDLSGMGTGAGGAGGMADLPGLDLDSIGDMGMDMGMGEGDDDWGLNFDNM